MILYLSHASNFDYQTELYEPLKEAFAGEHDIYYPHDPGNKGVHSKDFIANCDTIIAEVSYPSTGQGIELGWADAAGLPIVCFYKAGHEPSGALKLVATAMFAYDTTDDLVNKLPRYLK